MTYKHYNAVAEKIPEGIETATERALFLDVCYLADSKGILRMPQIELSQITLWSLATVKRVFDRLESVGLLVKVKHGRYQVNVSIVNIARETGSRVIKLKDKLVEWLEQNMDSGEVHDILASKEVYLNETQEDETVIAKAIETGLLAELRKEDYPDGELGTVYQLKF